jgi:hypothetical protein
LVRPPSIRSKACGAGNRVAGLPLTGLCT